MRFLSNKSISTAFVFRVHIYDLYINKYNPICVQAVVPKKRVRFLLYEIPLSFIINHATKLKALILECSPYSKEVFKTYPSISMWKNYFSMDKHSKNTKAKQLQSMFI